MEWKVTVTKTPYLVLFSVLIAIAVGTASAMITITLAGNVIVTDDLTVDTNSLFVDSSENKVGVGTITPSEKLDVKGNVAIDGSLDVSNAPIYSHRNPSTNTANLIIERTGGPTSDNVQFTLSHRATNKDLWLYGFNGTTFKNFVGFDYPNYKINFPTSGNALVIDGANEMVGIGTSNPSSKLHVVGDVQIDGNLTGTSLFKTYVNEVSLNNTGGNYVSGTVFCDEGDVRVGGGGHVVSGTLDEVLVSSLPNSLGEAWTAIFKNPDNDMSSSYRSYIVCLDLDPLH